MIHDEAVVLLLSYLKNNFSNSTRREQIDDIDLFTGFMQVMKAFRSPNYTVRQ